MNCESCNRKIGKTILTTEKGMAKAFKLCKKCFNEKLSEFDKK